MYRSELLTSSSRSLFSIQMPLWKLAESCKTHDAARGDGQGWRQPTAEPAEPYSLALPWLYVL